MPEPNEVKEGGATEGQDDAMKEGGEIQEEKKDATASKWEQLDDLGLPIVDKDKDPETYKEVEIVRGLIKQERTHG